MSGAEGVRWVFAAMFAALTVFYLVRLGFSRRDAPAWGGSPDRSVDVARAVMSLGMVAMLAPWVDPLPRLSWQVLFGVAAGYLAVRLIRRPARSAPIRRPGMGEPGPGGHRELHLVIGGVAMMYMLGAMPAEHAMAGMDMAQMSPTSFAPPALTWAFVVYFLVFVVRLGMQLAVPVTIPVTMAQPGSAGRAFLAGGPRGVVTSPHLLGSAEVVMGIGMSYMLLTML